MRPVWHVMGYLGLFMMQISLCRSDFRSAGIYQELLYLSYITFIILILRKIFACPWGKLSTEFTSPIAKSTSPGLSDMAFFARWIEYKCVIQSCVLICCVRTSFFILCLIIALCLSSYCQGDTWWCLYNMTLILTSLSKPLVL